jgi:hypothetical protein
MVFVSEIEAVSLTRILQRVRSIDEKHDVDDADYLMNVLDEDGYRSQMTSHGNRNAIGGVCWKIEQRTSLFATSFNHVEPQTAESWHQTLAVRHNSCQS